MCGCAGNGYGGTTIGFGCAAAGLIRRTPAGSGLAAIMAIAGERVSLLAAIGNEETGPLRSEEASGAGSLWAPGTLSR